MKLLFISDIHGIASNLSKMEEVINKEKIDKLVVLGDLYHNSLDINNELLVRNFLNKYKKLLICMRGNCDTLLDLKKSDFPICEDLSLICTDNINIYLNHGNKYNLYNNKKINNGVLVYGHEHIPYIEKESDMVYINVGSISLPRNNNDATYMLYENRKFTIYTVNDTVVDSIELQSMVNRSE